MVLHLLLIRRHFANIPQARLVILQGVLCFFGVPDHHVDGLQPEIKQMFS